MWPDAVPLRNSTTLAIMTALTSIFTRNGFPRVVVADNGSHYVGKKFVSFCKKWYMLHLTGPNQTVLVEKLHGTQVPMIVTGERIGENICLM